MLSIDQSQETRKTKEMKTHMEAIKKPAVNKDLNK